MNPIPTQPYEPTPLDQLLYTFAAAAQIIGIDINQIDNLIPYELGCQVILKNKSWSILIKQTDFLVQFVNIRKARARALVATQYLDDNNQSTVWNEANNNRYHLTVTTEFIYCECPDWQRQHEVFGHEKVCCKHSYAVLARLGFSSLRDYLKSCRKTALINQPKAV